MSKRNSDAVAEVANKKSRVVREIVDLVSEEEEEDSDSESEVYQDPVVEAYCKELRLARAKKERRIAMVRKMFKDKGEEEDSEFEVYQDPVIAGDEGYY